MGKQPPTEDQIKELGFKLVKRYDHDQFNTNRYKKGGLEVEFTYEIDFLVSCDLTIPEINYLPISFEDLKAITPIIGDGI